LLTYDRVRALVGHLAARFEFVIIDSAPILAASGTLVLAQSADRIVFIVRWGTTSQAIARHAVAQLDEFAGARAETLLSMVNMKRAAKYGDAAATVYRQLQKYYA
jgi:Mrp family chromosome partitioning ATPase